MAVPIIENWTVIRGPVRSIKPAPDRQGFALVTVAIEQEEPVEGFANLLAGSAGKQLEVLIPSDLIGKLGLGENDILEARVRRAPRQQIFVHQQHVSAQRPSRTRSTEQSNRAAPRPTERREPASPSPTARREPDSPDSPSGSGTEGGNRRDPRPGGSQVS